MSERETLDATIARVRQTIGVCHNAHRQRGGECWLVYARQHRQTLRHLLALRIANVPERRVAVGDGLVEMVVRRRGREQELEMDPYQAEPENQYDEQYEGRRN